MCPTIRSTSLSLAIIHDHPRIRTRVNAIERYSSVSERITHAIVADGDGEPQYWWRDTIGHSGTNAIPSPRARWPAFQHTQRTYPSPRFLLRRPRRRLQGDQGPSTFFRRSSRRERRERRDARAVVAERERPREMRIGRGGSSNDVDRGVPTARPREGDRRGRWVRGKRYARAFTARTRRGAAWTRARAPAHGRGRRYAHPRARDGDLLVDCVWEGGVC